MVEIFGKGKAGKSARLIVENESCKECGGIAVRTFDFDLLGDLEQIPVCAATVCLNHIRDRIVEEMQRRGQMDQRNTFSMNGLGRNDTEGLS